MICNSEDQLRQVVGWVDPIWKREYSFRDALVYMILKGLVPMHLRYCAASGAEPTKLAAAGHSVSDGKADDSDLIPGTPHCNLFGCRVGLI